MMRVVVVGAAGKMGREALRAITPEHGFEMVAAVVRSTPIEGVPCETSLPEAVARNRPDAVLDLSLAAAARANAQTALENRIPLVSGVTGLTGDDLAAIEALTERYDTPALIVPNFAIGAVLMMRFAEMAARWLPDAEVIERHHERKLDAPSGTAMLTAQRIAAARAGAGTVPPTQTIKAEGARGADVDGVVVHSVRLPGSLAHQEVLFGAPGETLTLRHDAADRSVYMPGIRLCLQRVRDLKGLTIGMDDLLFASTG
ncbi:MAG: 4-hydroxy-tetrahydrodipicolinate reductase [Fimbriimonas sp.]